ncbi:MAG: hypothetical protein NC205_02555 [Prevotella sp.]|nr:hypothetical protein [Alistipes senegalensis]MCM1357449.1 hypothetical protein [Prevotella sp.]
MYNVNDVVVYGSNGVCTVISVEERDFSGESVEYYVLRPVNNSKNTFYVPVSNTFLTGKMHHICTKKQIKNLIEVMSDECCIWIDNELRRKEEYRKIIDIGDRLQLVRLIKTLYIKSSELKGQHKKLHSADEKFFREAENILYEEFAYSLGIPRDSVVEYIKNHI